MRKPPVIPVAVSVQRPARIVQIDKRAFNVDQIVALSNTTDGGTIVHTSSFDFTVERPLAEVARLLNGEAA